MTGGRDRRTRLARTGPRAGETTGGVGLGRYRPEAMLDATRVFQRLLVSRGMRPAAAEHYVLTGNYSHARSRGVVLLAVVYRHSGMRPLAVASKHSGIVTTFRSEHAGWRAPYERDVRGRPVDEVVDWAGLEYGLLGRDAVVATLMRLAADAVTSGKRAPGYWEVELRWEAGEIAAVMQESLAKVQGAIPAS